MPWDCPKHHVIFEDGTVACPKCAERSTGAYVITRSSFPDTWIVAGFTDLTPAVECLKKLVTEEPNSWDEYSIEQWIGEQEPRWWHIGEDLELTMGVR